MQIAGQSWLVQLLERAKRRGFLYCAVDKRLKTAAAIQADVDALECFDVSAHVLMNLSVPPTPVSTATTHPLRISSRQMGTESSNPMRRQLLLEGNRVS